MSSFAHVASADYPPDVEDLIADHPAGPLAVAAVAGFAVIANAASQALLFGIAAGPELDAVSIPLQPVSHNRAPAISVWLPETRSDIVQHVGLAALSADGVLRVFRRLSVTSSGVPTCQEIRVLASLLQSSGADECLALNVVHVPRAKALYVFGSHNSAAIVSLRGARLEVRPLQRATHKDPSSLRFGSAFYSAIRSISIGIGGRNDSWIHHRDIHEIVSTQYVKDFALLVRAGGEVEKWSTRGLTWSFNLFDLLPGRDARNRAESSGITSDGTLVALVKSWSQTRSTRQILCFDVRHADVPQHIELQEPIRDIESHGDSPCFMVVSGDTAYLYLEESQTLAWLSVARGVPAEGQVRGSTPIEYCANVLAFVDASHCMPDAATKGGVTACLHSAGVWVASSSVPAPVSMDVAEDPRKHDSIRSSEPILWRAFLQFKVGQRGASKASLRGLVNSLHGYKLDEALSQIIEATSRRIITSVQDSERDPISLLVDTDLEKKHISHNAFLQMLADGELFSQIRPNAPSIAEDRLWDAMNNSSRTAVLGDNEMLAAAVCLRGFENSLADAKLKNHDASMQRRTSPSESITNNGTDFNDSEILKRVFRLLLNEETRSISSHDFLDLTWLYRHPNKFHQFLPTLYQSMKDGLSKLQKDTNSPDQSEVLESESIIAEMKRIILLSCEACASVVQGSLDAREENYELFSRGRDGIDCIDCWVCHKKNSRDVLWNVAETCLLYSRRTTASEKQPILRAVTKVIDEYLRSSGSRLARKKYMSSEPFTRSNSQKRRRIDLDHETSEWGREIRRALDKLRQYGMNKDAFRLAEKYEDFGTMLCLKVHEENFDSFMEDSIQKFGDEFAFYAFRWLEQKGEFHLLLSGSRDPSESEPTHKGTRSERITVLLTDYLRKDRQQFSNLAWMHWFSTGNFAEGIVSLLKQVNCVSVPEKKGSKASSFSLCSIAKLALQAVEKEAEQYNRNQRDMLSVMIARLFLISVQDEFSPGRDALMHGADLVRQIIEQSSTDSENLAKTVVQALRVVEVCETIGDLTASELGDYVWRRCVERQKDLWVPLAQNLSTISDISLREKLTGTALYKAVQESELTASSVLDVMDRGNLKESVFVGSEYAEEVNRLVRTTVALATS